MAATRQVTLVLHGPGNSQIVIDGKDLAGCVGALQLSADASSLPRLTLNLHVNDLRVNGEMTVSIPDATAEALIVLGWTPPGAED